MAKAKIEREYWGITSELKHWKHAIPWRGKYIYTDYHRAPLLYRRRKDAAALCDSRDTPIKLKVTIEEA
jgi:hypothetical protein